MVTGYHRVPDYTETVLQIAGRSDKIITSPESLVIADDNETDFGRTAEVPEAESLELIQRNEKKRRDDRQNSVGVQTDKEPGAWEKLTDSNITFFFSKDFITFSYGTAKSWLNQQENKGLKLTLIVLVGCIFAMFWYFTAQVYLFLSLQFVKVMSVSKNVF